MIVSHRRRFIFFAAAYRRPRRSKNNPSYRNALRSRSQSFSLTPARRIVERHDARVRAGTAAPAGIDAPPVDPSLPPMHAFAVPEARSAA